MKILNLFYIVIGFISFGLGTFGIFVPFLPTVPFYLLTSFCFAKGSPRFEKWFKSTKLYKKYLYDFEKDKALSVKSKIVILAFSSFMIIFAIMKSKKISVAIILSILEIFKYYYFIFKIKNK